MKRSKPINMGHNAFTCGKNGLLKTFMRIPVIAGDSIRIDYSSIVRLTQLSQWMVLDAVMDFFIFWVPHRHCYDNWEDFIKEGRQTDEVLATVDPDADNNYAPELNYLCSKATYDPIPAHIPRGYNAIWNEFFRNAANTDEIDRDYIPEISVTQPWDLGNNTQSDARRYGLACSRLDKFWNSGIDVTRADNSSFQQMDVSGGTLELLGLRDQQAIYKDAQELDWFAKRYRDVLDHKWGTGMVNTDADQRPSLLWHERSLLSGKDIYRTDAEVGTYNGVSVGQFEFSMPSRYFQEHGTIWGMHLLRFPSILEDEVHYMDRAPLNWANMAMDPEYVAAQPPIEIKKGDIFEVSGADANVSLGLQPFANWMRHQPDWVDTNFKTMTGFPFLQTNEISELNDALYHTYDTFNDQDDFMIGSIDKGHYNVSAGIAVEKRSTLPEATSSVFAGSSLR